MVSIFEHKDYRSYLRHHLKSLPLKGRGELTRIANNLSVNTTLLSQIMSGTRELNPEQAFRLSQYLQHTPLETDYFSLLVQIERAGTNDLKEHLKKKLALLRQDALKLSSRIAHERSLTDSERAIFYSSWIYSAIHLFTSTHKNGVALEEITARFNLSRFKATEIIQFLVSTGLCTEQSGRYSLGVQSTFLAQGSPFLTRHHSNWRMKAIQKSENISEEEMMYSGQVSLSRKDFESIREQLVTSLKNILRQVEPSPAENIASLNIDWFWIDR
jgi:uncharacterized protein (TIGR02147 family)